MRWDRFCLRLDLELWSETFRVSPRYDWPNSDARSETTSSINVPRGSFSLLTMLMVPSLCLVLRTSVKTYLFFFDLTSVFSDFKSSLSTGLFRFCVRYFRSIKTLNFSSISSFLTYISSFYLLLSISISYLFSVYSFITWFFSYAYFSFVSFIFCISSVSKLSIFS